MEADDTLPKWLSRHARERGDAPAVRFQDSVLSWKELERAVEKTAKALSAQGIGRGDVVAVQLPNTPPFLLAYLAIARLGAVMCTLHMPYRSAEIETLTRHSGAKLLLNADSFDGLSGEQALPPEPGTDDPFLLLYTSGTTAAPKGVLHTPRAMLGNGRLGAIEHRLSAADRVLSAAPLSHLYGLYSLHCAWSVGACVVLLPQFKPDDLNAVIEKHQPTALWTAPAHVAACRAHLDKWTSLKLAIVSGSTASPELIRFFSRQVPNCAVTQLWGMTELQAGLFTRPGDPVEVHATTTGRPSPGAEVRIADDGELQVRGPMVFKGYLKSNENPFTADGWFRSGDLAKWVDGNVAITGRSKDIINRGGVKFNPAEVETLLDAHPKVLQSAIVPMPDPVLGERACAFVTLKTAQPVSLPELVEYLLQKGIAKNKLPERLVVVPEMPLTPTRKIIKGRLRLPD